MSYPQPLLFWCQKVIPLVYDESLSYYEVLCKTVDYLNKMLSDQQQMAAILQQHDTDITLLQQQVSELQAEIEKVKNGDYVSLYLDSLINWIDNNIQALVGRIVTYVTFGLTDDGRFAAYIPDPWKFMQFDTIIDPTNPMYGHLVLNW